MLLSRHPVSLLGTILVRHPQPCSVIRARNIFINPVIKATDPMPPPILEIYHKEVLESWAPRVETRGKRGKSSARGKGKCALAAVEISCDL